MMNSQNFHYQRPSLGRREFVKGLGAGLVALAGPGNAQAQPVDEQRAQICITMDLEMSRDYPMRGMLEWDYQKGNLDEATKRYSLEAAQLVKQRGGVIHFFCVGRVLEQPSVDWLKEIAAAGHPVGNHTYDHVNIMAARPTETQFRFQRSPWLVEGKTTEQVIRENIEQTTRALEQRAAIQVNGFRTPGGFTRGLHDRADLQQMLLELGFSWTSSLYPQHKVGPMKQEPTNDVYQDIVRAQQEAQPVVYPSGLIELPMSPVSDVTAFRSQHWKLEWFLTAVRQAVAWAIEHRGVFDFLCHPSCMVVEDPQLATFRLICDLVQEAGDRAELVGLDAVARRISRQAVDRSK